MYIAHAICFKKDHIINKLKCNFLLNFESPLGPSRLLFESPRQHFGSLRLSILSPGKPAYLSKVNLGRKVVHWMRTLSQDSCSLYEPMHPTHLSPLLLSCQYLFIGLGNWVGGDDKNANYRETYAHFFSVFGLNFF